MGVGGREEEGTTERVIEGVEVRVGTKGDTVPPSLGECWEDMVGAKVEEMDGEGNKEGDCWRVGNAEGVTPVTVGVNESPEEGVLDSVPVGEAVVLTEGVLEGDDRKVCVPPPAAKVGEGSGDFVGVSVISAVKLECGKVGVGVLLPPADRVGCTGEAEVEAVPPR